MALVPDAYLNTSQPYYVPYYNTTEITADIQLSTLNVNDAGLIRLTSDGINPDIAAAISFDRVKTEFPSFLAMNSNVLGAGNNSNQITVMNNTRTGYEDLALSKLVLYGNASVGSFPIAQFVEQGVSGNLSIVSPQVNISTLNGLCLIGVSTINGVPPPFGGGGGASISTFSTVYASTLYVKTGNFSTINVSSINGSEFTTTGINVNTLTTAVLSSQQSYLSTITFNPSLGGVSLKPNIDLGMGGFLGGLAGGLGGGIFNALLGGAALTTGIMALTQSRGTNSINSNNYELVNATTQLQFSTLNNQTVSILRLVNSASPNIPGVEFFQSTIISPGTNCIRSLSDPLNIANPDIATSTIQAFGQWVPLPTAVVADSVSSLTVSSINSSGWNQIQYQNQQSVNQGIGVVVNGTNNILYIGLSFATLPTPTNAYFAINLVNGRYTYQTFVDMVNAVLGQSGGPSQIQLSVNPTTNIISINAVNLNISPLAQTYTIIWNPLTGSPYLPSNFTPPWTPTFITASSVLFGAALVNVVVTINPLSPTRVLPQPISLSSFIAPVSFGPYLQMSTLLVASTINCPFISTASMFLSSINGAIYPPVASQLQSSFSTLFTSSINLVSINGSAYPPPASQFQSSFSTLYTSSINNTGWDTIRYWNVAPTPNPTSIRQYIVTTGVNNVLQINASSATVGSAFNYSQTFLLTAGTYTPATFVSMVNAVIVTQSAPFTGSPFKNITIAATGPSNQPLLQFINSTSPAPPPADTAYIINFNESLSPAFVPVVTNAQVTQSGLLFGSSPSASYPVIPATNVIMPSVGGTIGNGPFPFGADLQVSSINVQGSPIAPTSLILIGSIILYAGLSQAPTGYLFCDGSTYSIASYTALYAVIGNIYGGDGTTTFAVPDLQMRVPVGSIKTDRLVNNLANNSTNLPVLYPNVPGQSGNVIMIVIGVFPGSLPGAASQNMIVGGMTFNTGGADVFRITSVLWQGYSINGPASAVNWCVLATTTVSHAYDGSTVNGNFRMIQGPITGPAPDGVFTVGFETYTPIQPYLSSFNLPPHSHEYGIFKGGASGNEISGAPEPIGQPNVQDRNGVSGNGYTTDGNGMGYNIATLNFNSNFYTQAASFTYNGQAQVPVSPPPYTVVNYLIKY